MGNLRKYLAIACAGAIGVLGIVLFFKSQGCCRKAGLFEKTAKGLDETARDSIKGLNKAVSHIQNVFEQLTVKRS